MKTLKIFLFVATALAAASCKVEAVSYTHLDVYKRQMLLPSLAPGLSCFPFIAEFLGEKSVAMAALGDVGNKFFVLIFLYVIAMNMFLKNTKSEETKMGEKIKSLLMNIVQEPINIIIISAAVLLSLGSVSYTHLDVYKRQGS